MIITINVMTNEDIIFIKMVVLQTYSLRNYEILYNTYLKVCHLCKIFIVNYFLKKLGQTLLLMCFFKAWH